VHAYYLVMKISEVQLRRCMAFPRLIFLLVLLQVAENAIVSFPSTAQTSGDVSQQLRPYETSPKSANLRQRRPIVALQASMKTRALAEAGTKLSRMLQRQDLMTRREEAGRCKGRKLIWWIKMRRKCQKEFGKESKWDRKKMGGQCTTAWKSCNTGFYTVCCSQPAGPKTLNAYCEKEELQKKNLDQACKVNGMMKGVNKDMGAISSTVMSMDKANGANLHFQFSGGAPSPAVAGAPSYAGAGASGAGAAGANGGAAGAAGANGAGAGAASKDQSLKGKCAQITELLRRSEEKMKQIRMWAKRNGVRGLDDDGDGHVNFVQKSIENPEFKDPDLVLSLKSVLAMGQKLKALLDQNTFCSYAVGDDDDGARGLLDDLKKNKNGASDDDDNGDGEGDDDDGSDDNDAEVNATAITELLEYDSELKQSIDKFETGVHPHGYKWWRYRYEYSLVESFVLAWSVMLMYFLQMLFFGASFFHVHRFYKTGRPVRNYRYSFLYWVFHAACSCVMVFTAYMLYVPWGKDNPFDVFATAFHDFVDERFHVPYLGYSWLFMVLDVQFQMFMTYCLYALFTIMVVNNYVAALVDWKQIDDGQEAVNPINRKLYDHCLEVIQHRTGVRPGENKEALQDIFKSEGLRLEGVKELEVLDYGDDKGAHNFKIHLYLTDGLGKSIEYLVEVSLITNLWLAICALIVAALAHYYELAFMFFLPPFVIIGIVFLVMGLLISKHYTRLSLDTNHDKVSKYVTVHSYCRAIQVILYCVFFSFSRLLLSNDIYTGYPKVYFGALLGVICFLALLAMFGGEVLKEATCALILVPHISHEKFKNNLREIKLWHTNVKCHECGVEQIPFNAAFSVAYAGRRSSGRETARSSVTSTGRRRWSFR